ncbi:uncharacterized protein METZ01_LOCUS3364, partial [marine metagenome]
VKRSHFNAEHCIILLFDIHWICKVYNFRHPKLPHFLYTAPNCSLRNEQNFGDILYRATDRVFAVFTRFFCSNLHAVNRAPNFRNYN